jgi:hypothetical protein
MNSKSTDLRSLRLICGFANFVPASSSFVNRCDVPGTKPSSSKPARVASGLSKILTEDPGSADTQFAERMSIARQLPSLLVADPAP